MKKLLLALVLLVGPLRPAFADLKDHVHATLLEHVSLTALVQNGESDLGLLDSIVQIGKYNGEYILGLQLGFAGGTVPEAGEAQSAKYMAGVMLRLSPFVKSRLNLPGHWEFIRALEYGPSYHHDFREHDDIIAFSVGLAFDPTPKQ